MKRIFTLLLTLSVMCLGWQDLNAQGDCATAVDVTANLTATCNVITNTATFTGGGLEDICGMASAPTDAIWFSFTAPFDGLFDVTNTMDPLTPDTQMGIGTGTCGTLTCQPNWTATVDDGGNGFTSAMMGTAMTAGTTYYIEWGDGWATGPADFEIRLVEAANASNVTATTADVNTIGTCAAIEWGLPGFGLGAGTPVTSGSQITGLTPATTYEICSQSCDAFGDGEALCGWTGITSGAESETTAGVCYTFTTQALCADPTAASVAVNAASPLDLDVTVTSGSGLYDIEYGPAGFALGAGTQVLGQTASPYTITGLACGDVIDVYVRDDCGATGVSFWVLAGTADNTISGCTDVNAENYDASACSEDGSCTYTGLPVGACIDFDAGIPGNFVQSLTDNFDWSVGASTPSTGTGPSAGDNTSGTGQFIYIETSSGAAGDIASASVSWDLTGATNPALQFYFDMLGAQIGTLNVYVDDGTGPVNIFTISGDQGGGWTLASPTLTAYAGQTVTLIFEAVHNGTFAGDIALDDICVIDASVCGILADGLIVNPCDDGGTASDVSDDTFTFSLNPNGTLLTTGYAVSGDVTGTGTYGAATLFDNGGAGFPIGTDLVITLTDNNDPTCTFDVTVVSPGTCSPFPLPPVGVTCTGAAAPFVAFSETFADNSQGWTGVGTAGGTWELFPGAAGGSTGTGPNVGNDNDGTYIIYEASGGCPGPSSLISPPINLASGVSDAELSYDFYYWGNQADIGVYDVEVSTDGGVTFTSLFTFSDIVQTDGDSPWGVAGLSLAPYLGQTIVLAWTQSGCSNFDADFALDNVVVTTCVAGCALSDAGLIDGTCDDGGTFDDSSDDTYDFTLDPIGTNTGTTYTVSGGAAGTGTYGTPLVLTGTAGAGDLTVTITDDTDPTCTITITVTDPGTCSPFTPFVLDQCVDFDAGIPVGYNQSTTDNFDWSIGTATGSGGTGPQAGDNTTGTGQFIFIETSGAPVGNVAQIQAAYAVSGTNPTLQFYYDMLGAQIGTLNVLVDDGTGNVNVFTISGDQGGGWTLVSIPLTAYIGGNVLVTFEAITNGSYQGDISLDDICMIDASVCGIQGAGLVTGLCDVATNSFTFDLNPNGTLLGTTYTVSDPSATVSGTGTYGAATTFGPYPVSVGPLTVTITDDTDPACSTDIIVTPPVCPGPGDACNNPIVIPEACSTAFTQVNINLFGGSIANDGANALWYSYAPTADGTLTFGSCLGGADTEVAFHDGGTAPDCTTFANPATLEADDDCLVAVGGSSFASEIVDAPVVAGNTYFIEWGDQWSTGPFDWTIDFTCATPAGSTADSTGLVTFTVPNGGTIDLEYGPTGFAQGSGTVIAGATSPTSITGLMDGTDYDVYVCNDCLADPACQSCELVTFTAASACTDCAVTACTQSLPCDDGDPCTTGEVEITLLSDGTVCTPCGGGTAVTDPGTCNTDCTMGDTEVWDPTTCACVVDVVTVLGCTNASFCEYDPSATCNDGTCVTPISDPGTCNTDCTMGDLEAWNATTCLCEVTSTPVLGCTDPAFCEYNPMADCDDGTCVTSNADPGTCDDGDCTNGVETWDATACACMSNPVTDVLGCTDPAFCEYDPLATCDDGTCATSNADPGTCDDGVCTNGVETWDSVACACQSNPVTDVLGCTDPAFCEYDPMATCDDGSCMTSNSDPGTCNTNCFVGDTEVWDAATCACVVDVVTVLGCTDPMDTNYDATANCDDGTCASSVLGCTDMCADNFDPLATFDDGSQCNPYDSSCNTDCTMGDLQVWNPMTCSCETDIVTVLGCTDPAFCEYDPAANCDDGTCATSTADPGTCNTDCLMGDLEAWNAATCLCEVTSTPVPGCTDPAFCEYNPMADCDDGTCTTSTADPGTCNTDCLMGDLEAWNAATCLCEVTSTPVPGCTDPAFCEYNPMADCDDGTCTTSIADPGTCNTDCLLGDIEAWNATTCACEVISTPIVGCTDPLALNYDATADCDAGCTYSTAVVSNDADIVDPCTCNNDESAPGAGDGTFEEEVSVISGNTGETWTVTAVTGATGANVGDILAADGIGGYHIFFDHVNNIGYNITVEGPGPIGSTSNQILYSTNVCQYIMPPVSDLAASYCVDDNSVVTIGTTSTGVTLTGSTVDGAPATSFIPSALGLGTHTYSVSVTGGAVGGSAIDAFNGDASDPAAVQATMPAAPVCESMTTGTFDIVTCITCPTLGSGTLSASEICSGDMVSGSVPITCGTTGSDVTVEWSLDGVSQGAVSQPCGDAMGSWTLTNTNCISNTQLISWTITCDLSGALIGSGSMNVEVYPADVTSFLTASTDGCTSTVTLDPSCAPADFVIPADQVAAPGASGTHTFTVSYLAGPGCTTVGPLSVAYACALPGCTDPCSANYNASATTDDGSCTAQLNGCTDPTACNYDATALCDDGSCLPAPTCNTDICLGDTEIVDPADACGCIVDVVQVLGCTDATAANYDPAANCDDGGCIPTMCPALFSFAASTNVACDGDVVNFTAALTDATATNVTMTVALSGSVAAPTSLTYDGAAWTGSTSVANTDCAPMMSDYILTVVCTDDGSTVAIQSQDVTVYPNGIAQFIEYAPSADGCSVTASVQAGCDTYVSLTGATTQTAAGAGAETLCFDIAYFSNSAPQCITTPSQACYTTTCAACSAESGIMPSGIQIACYGETMSVAAAGANPGSGNTLAYVMHDGTFTTIYGWSLSGLFANDGSIPTNIFPEPVISSVAGPAGVNGYPDLADPCTDVSPYGTPVRFLTEIVITHEYICNEISGEYDVTFSVSGGYPDYPNGNNAFYTVSGDWTGSAYAGSTYSFGPIADGTTYTLQVIDDQKGCGTSVSDTPECGKTPVALMAYTGEVLEEGNMLKWVTATETNNDFFTMEVSEDGGSTFRYLATVQGNGTTLDMSSYDLLHSDAIAGTSYYRLSQTDFDGTTVDLGIVALTRGETAVLDIISISPVPAVSTIDISYISAADAEVTITVTDASGKTLASGTSMTAAGINAASFDISSMAAGVYFLSIQTADAVSTQKFVKE